MTAFGGPTHRTITPDKDIDADDGARTDDRREVTTRAWFAPGISGVPSIADQYFGLLDELTPGQRRGLIARLSVGYYDGWRPTRVQLARHIRNEFGVTTVGFHGNKNPFLRAH